MNKDFWNKPISLKDIKIDLKDIKNIKNIKNKKEIVIGILAFIYVVIIIVVGNNLLTKRSELKAQYDIKEQRYEALQNSAGEDVLKKQIEEIVLEKEKVESKIAKINSNTELMEIFADFKANAPITWADDQQDIRPRLSTGEFEAYEVYSVEIRNFTGTFSNVEDFLEYVDNYSKVVRLDSLNFRQSTLTGKLIGDARLSFYFKK